MRRLKLFLKPFTPLQLLVIGYLLVTLSGALLLSLPVSSAGGTHQPFLDALFVATSGISTSGLTVVDIGSYYSLFGQLVLMSIFQIGGIGYMTFVIFIAYLLGIKMSIKTNIVAKESLSTDSYSMLGKFFKNVFLYTFIFEFTGALILAIFWLKEFPLGRSLYLGVFHSISAFCTAGFSVFPTSLVNYKNSLVVNLTIDLVSIIGGIGFFVLLDLYNLIYKKHKNIFPRRLTLHTRMALLVTGSVMVIGALVIFVSEKWTVDTGLVNRIMISLFQSISASTTDGYNSIDIGVMSNTSLTVLMVLMFIGASPGSTGGGIKTTTLGTLFISVKSTLEESKGVNVFGREIPLKSVLRAFAVFSLFVLIAFIDILILSQTEKGSYIQVMFEIISALGNTGLSTGITSGLTFTGKLVLIITMFIGRVGPLTIGLALLKKSSPLYKYPQEDIFIG